MMRHLNNVAPSGAKLKAQLLNDLMTHTMLKLDSRTATSLPPQHLSVGIGRVLGARIFRVRLFPRPFACPFAADLTILRPLSESVLHVLLLTLELLVSLQCGTIPIGSRHNHHRWYSAGGILANCHTESRISQRSSIGVRFLSDG